jgi:hypothetical protein
MHQSIIAAKAMTGDHCCVTGQDWLGGRALNQLKREINLENGDFWA